LSVISDIDDTIKNTEVSDQRKLLRNTFLNDFLPVDGMADVYRRWRQAGAAFHYVSSSPWQLVESLSELLIEHDFPMGSMHLRSIRLRDPSILQLFVARRYSKRRVIRSILRMFPHRSFVLVGDSGEKDAEIYGSMARRFPQQVKQILIRKVDGAEQSYERTAKAFKGIASSTWRFFDDPSELADIQVNELAVQ
jgi:phosphatidate phosphatase APP1